MFTPRVAFTNMSQIAPFFVISADDGKILVTV